MGWCMNVLFAQRCSAARDLLWRLTSIKVLHVSGLRYKFYSFDTLVTDCKVALPFLGLGRRLSKSLVVCSIS